MADFKFLDLQGVQTLVDKIDAKYATKKEVSNLTNINLDDYATKEDLEAVKDKIPSDEAIEKVAKEAIDKVVGAAPEALDTLEEIAEALADNDDTVAALTATLATKASKEEVEEAVKDTVKYQKFTYTNSDNETATRKTIQLDNYDTISGIGTDGKGYNLVMLSKWNIVDCGSSSIAFNINAKDGKVTINDNKEVATVDQIPVVKAIDTKEIAKMFELDA